MAKNKTQITSQSVSDYIAEVPEDQKRKDSFRLIQLMEEATGEIAKMWGASIIGFGQYHYKYASGHEGDAPLLGFSPRKAAISLYIYVDQEEQNQYLEKLGKYKMGKACIYIKKLSDIDETILVAIMKITVGFLRKM